MRARIHIAEEQGCSPHLWCLLNVIRAAFLSFELGLCCMFWHPRNCSVVLTTLRRRFLFKGTRGGEDDLRWGKLVHSA